MSIHSDTALLSTWVDEANLHKDPEALLWGRVCKIAEESGEVVQALIGATGQNPRKGVTHTMGDVEKELLDVVVTALGAIYHLNPDDPITLEEKVAMHLGYLTARAGLR